MIAITKKTLRQLNAATGKLDVDSEQVFVGFVGRLHMSDRLYYGELRFSPAGDDPPEDIVSIQSILGSQPLTASVEMEEVTDGDPQD